MTAVTFDAASFQADLVAHGLIVPTAVRGAWGRGPVFEDLLARFDALVMRNAAAQGAEPMTYPPVIGRALLEKLGYLDNFPQLIGSVHSFFGGDTAARELATRAARGERWESALDITELMLLPAACYPVYPNFSGLLEPGGRLVTTVNWCYRHEPSDEPTRLQSFRMREFVLAGSAEAVLAWRGAWLAEALALFEALGLPARSDIANDPFFGRAGRMLAAGQREQSLKFEILVPVVSLEAPTAIASFNWHQEHFSSRFGIAQADGRRASTACLAFGLERVTLALLRTHGMDPATWPAKVRERLWPAAAAEA